ncbi:unnamed protein product [Prorocentrum cordatum]|uniref:Fucoxanthin-chlorophyll a/c light-harvesting protein n=1 Tax=Prorocentrum cordatum TaxID=2364126 RepID=A0ABN9QQU8_9DINO|nr:unnamed protein product [Polarella glacialis]
MRCTEIKHSRVAMWAAMGYIVPEFLRWLGGVALDGPAFASLPNGLSALGKVSGAGWGQRFLFCGFLELYTAKQDPTDPPGKLSRSEAGFGKSYFGALKVFKGDGIADPEKNKRSLSAELANGRLAMMAIIGVKLSLYEVPRGTQSSADEERRIAEQEGRRCGCAETPGGRSAGPPSPGSSARG